LLPARPTTVEPKEVTVEEAIKQLCQDLARAEYAKTTQDSYKKTAIALSERFGCSVAELTRDQLREYVDAVVAEDGGRCRGRVKLCRNLSTRVVTTGQEGAQSHRKRRVRQSSGLCDVSFIKLPKRYSALPAVLSLNEVAALLPAIRNRRYQAVATVMYGTGLRVAEAIALQVGDIDGARGVVRVRHGKGNKAREAKLSQSLYVWLRRYWDKERPPLPFLFSNPSGKLPSQATLRQAFALAAKQARINKHVTPHVLRHSFATHLLEQGTDVRVVSALLGHARISTTARYARVTEKLIQQTPSPLDLLPQRRW
jgi:site-specific recombinase XerD